MLIPVEPGNFVFDKLLWNESLVCHVCRNLNHLLILAVKDVARVSGSNVVVGLHLRNFFVSVKNCGGEWMNKVMREHRNRIGGLTQISTQPIASQLTHQRNKYFEMLWQKKKWIDKKITWSRNPSHVLVQSFQDLQTESSQSQFIYFAN